MINWDALVHAPTQTIFGKPMTVVPLASIPTAPPYIARGIWKVHAIDVPMEDGSIMSSQTNRLTIRISEFPVMLKQGDKVILDQLPAQLGTLDGGTTYIVDDDDPDGQGATDLTLKQASADGAFLPSAP